MLVKSFMEMGKGRDDAIVFATQADEGSLAMGSHLPGLDGEWVTEANSVVLGFKAGRTPEYGYTRLNRQQVMELAVFLAECASHMKDMKDE